MEFSFLVLDVIGFQHAKVTSVGEKRDEYKITYIAHRNDAKQHERQKNLKLNLSILTWGR
jgi:hypothetical protein